MYTGSVHSYTYAEAHTCRHNTYAPSQITYTHMHSFVRKDPKAISKRKALPLTLPTAPWDSEPGTGSLRGPVFEVLQKLIPRQGFGGRWFVWEVIPQKRREKGSKPTTERDDKPATSGGLCRGAREASAGTSPLEGEQRPRPQSPGGTEKALRQGC